MIYVSSLLIPLLALLPNLFFAASGGGRGAAGGRSSGTGAGSRGAAQSVGLTGRSAPVSGGFASSLIGAGGASGSEPLAYVLLERVGQVGVFLTPLLYPIRFESTVDLVCLVGMAVALGFYYACWTRYYARGRKRSLLYRSFIGVPIPMAIMPVVYFLFAAEILRAPLLVAAAVVLGAGHIPITLIQRKTT